MFMEWNIRKKEKGETEETEVWSLAEESTKQ
jgi:hypothetical protein